MEDSQTMKRAEASLGKLGLELPKKYDGKPESLEWPENVADLPTNILAKHMSWWAGWAAYVGPEVARAETNLTAFEAKYKVQMGMEMQKRQGDFAKVTELKAVVSQLECLQEIEMCVLEAKATGKLLKSMLVAYELRYNTISREITRRGGEYDRSNRG